MKRYANAMLLAMLALAAGHATGADAARLRGAVVPAEPAWTRRSLASACEEKTCKVPEQSDYGTAQNTLGTATSVIKTVFNVGMLGLSPTGAATAVAKTGMFALDGVVGVLGSGATASEGSQWAKLEDYIAGNTEYLVCKVEEIVGGYFATHFNELDDFNHDFAGIQKKWFDQCPDRQCASYGQGVDGQALYDAHPDCCEAMTSFGTDQVGNDADCASASEADIAAGRASCELQIALQTRFNQGVCGADRRCYACYNTWTLQVEADDVVNDYLASDTFNNGVTALDADEDSLEALIAYTKMSAFMTQLYVHRLMLGAQGAENDLRQFAADRYAWIKSRYAALTNTRAGIVDAVAAHSTSMEDLDEQVVDYFPYWLTESRGFECQDNGWAAPQCKYRLERGADYDDKGNRGDYKHWSTEAQAFEVRATCDDDEPTFTFPDAQHPETLGRSISGDFEPYQQVEVTFLTKDFCTSEHPCRAGRGDCDSEDHCEGDLRCFEREAGDGPPPGAVWAEGSEELQNSGYDFCYDATLTKAEDLGKDACTEDSPCSVGQGDCDTDLECEGTLACWIRQPGDLPPRGVYWGHTDAEQALQDASAGHDFCYQPMPTKPTVYLGDEACSTDKPCWAGQGDCDNDGECTGSLVCGKRDSGDPAPYGLHFGDKDHEPGQGDYCYLPEALAPVPTVYYADEPAAADSGELQAGEGDCDNDNECAGDLKCFKRDAGDPSPPGVYFNRPTHATGSGDFCYDPSELLTADEKCPNVDPSNYQSINHSLFARTPAWVGSSSSTTAAILNAQCRAALAAVSGDLQVVAAQDRIDLVAETLSDIPDVLDSLHMMVTLESDQVEVMRNYYADANDFPEPACDISGNDIEDH